MQISKIIGEMVDSGLRRRIREIHIRLPVLLILGLQVIIIFRLVVVLRHKVSNIRLVELNQPHLIILSIFVGIFTMDTMKRGEISAIIMVSLVIYNKIILRIEFP